MKKVIIIACAVLLASCVKQSWTCHCTVTTTTKITNQSSTTTYTQTLKENHTTKNKAEQGPCVSTEETNTYPNGKEEDVRRDCAIN